LSCAIDNAVAAWREFIDESMKARAATPNRGTEYPWVDGTLLQIPELRRLVASELHRCSGSAVLGPGGKAFPGAEAPSLDFAQQPGKLPPLLVRVKEANAYILAKLEPSNGP
jgi:hypothetical protein